MRKGEVLELRPSRVCFFQFQIKKTKMDDQDTALAKHGHIRGQGCWLWVSPNGHIGDCYPPKVDLALVACVAACIAAAMLVGFALQRCKYRAPLLRLIET